MQRMLGWIVLGLLFAAPAAAKEVPLDTRSSLAPVLLSQGEVLVLSARIDEAGKAASGTNPCFLVRFEIRDLLGEVVAGLPQPVEVEAGETASFEVSHADLAQGIEPCFLVGIVLIEPDPQTPDRVARRLGRSVSLQVADAAGVRIYAEQDATTPPRRLRSWRTVRESFAPVLLTPGESPSVAVVNEALEIAGGVSPCMLVGIRLVDADGNVLAETQVPVEVDPGEGVAMSYSFEDLFGNANLPQSVAALVAAQPVEIPGEEAQGILPCMSLQVASAAGVEIYAEK